MLNLFSRACIVQAVYAGSLYVNSTISMENTCLLLYKYTVRKKTT